MVFGISFGKIQAEEIRLIRENGAASSGRIEDGTEEQYAKLKQLDYIKQVWEKHFFVGEATEVSENNAKTICNVVWADLESWNSFFEAGIYQCDLEATHRKRRKFYYLRGH